MTSKPHTQHLIRLINLRWLYIVVELTLLLLWGGGFIWLSVIALQLGLQLISLIFLKLRSPTNSALLTGQLAADLLLFTGLLYLTGGATNAYVSALLIPVALAAVMLKPFWLFQILALAIACYSSLLFWLPNHVQHIHDMASHFIGMWVNFLLTALVVTFVVAAIARELRQREIELAEQKLQALRQQQLLALGAAAAQTAHDLATPVATLSLLQEELQESYPLEPDVKAMAQPLARCQASIQRLREVTEQLREQRSLPVQCELLTQQLLEQSQLLWPEVAFSSHSDCAEGVLKADASLLPALMNLVQNAVQAALSSQQAQVTILSKIEQQTWLLAIKNPASSQQTHALSGEALVDSEHGFGMALMLTRTVIERLGGSLTLLSEPEQVSVQVRLPLEPVT